MLISAYMHLMATLPKSGCKSKNRWICYIIGIQPKQHWLAHKEAEAWMRRTLICQAGEEMMYHV
jgi:hypothetical protein